MSDVSRKALKTVVQKNLTSAKRGMVDSLMRKAGINPAHSGSVKGYQAQKFLKKMKDEGLFKASSRHTTAAGFDRQIKEASAAKGPDPKVVAARKMLTMRERMVEEEKKKAEITKALARGPAAKKEEPSAHRAQAPAVGGRAIGQAAREASRPGGGALGGFSGADRVERGPSAPAAAPERPQPEAVDMFGED